MNNPNQIDGESMEYKSLLHLQKNVKSEELGEKVNGPRGKGTQRSQNRRAYENLTYNGDITSAK